MCTPLTFHEIDILISAIQQGTLSQDIKLGLIKIINKNAWQVKNIGVLKLCRDHLWIKWSEALSVIEKNSLWSIPTISELDDLYLYAENNSELKVESGFYWAQSNSDGIVTYNPVNKQIKNAATHDSYLNFDGGDFSTFTPFYELNNRLILKRKTS
jgi:hypothetical protein